jgi:hypothetical protein
MYDESPAEYVNNPQQVVVLSGCSFIDQFYINNFFIDISYFIGQPLIEQPLIEYAG